MYVNNKMNNSYARKGINITVNVKSIIVNAYKYNII